MAKTEKTEAPVAATTYDPWKDMKDVFLERSGRDEPKSLYVCVNGRDFMIPKGKTVQVPAPIARLVESHKRAKARLLEEMAEIESNSAPDVRNQFRQF